MHPLLEICTLRCQTALRTSRMSASIPCAQNIMLSPAPAPQLEHATGDDDESDIDFDDGKKHWNPPYTFGNFLSWGESALGSSRAQSRHRAEEAANGMTGTIFHSNMYPGNIHVRSFCPYLWDSSISFDGAYITWISNGKPTWSLRSAGMGPDTSTEIGARPISKEPMVRCIQLLGTHTKFNDLLTVHYRESRVLLELWCYRLRTSDVADDHEYRLCTCLPRGIYQFQPDHLGSV